MIKLIVVELLMSNMSHTNIFVDLVRNYRVPGRVDWRGILCGSSPRILQDIVDLDLIKRRLIGSRCLLTYLARHGEPFIDIGMRFASIWEHGAYRHFLLPRLSLCLGAKFEG